MKRTKLIGLVLVALGVLALAVGGFSYTRQKDKVDLGPVHVTVTDRKTVNVPVWAGVALAIAGGVLLARKDGA